jgi:hypothetical protein
VTVPSVQVPSTVVLPDSWVSPVVVPATLVSLFPPSSVVFISSVAIIEFSQVPSSIPATFVAPIPSSNVIAVAELSTIAVPAYISSPVIAPVSWV